MSTGLKEIDSDFNKLLDAIDEDRKSISHGRSVRRGSFGVGKWGSLVIELLSYPDEVDQILADYGLSQKQFQQLMDNEIFKSVYKDTKSTIEALASNGGYQLSARRLAEHGLTVLEDIMDMGEDKDRLKAVELAARLANLDPLVQAKLKEQTASSGVQLVVNFGGGMPLPDSFKVMDAEYSEVKDD